MRSSLRLFGRPWIIVPLCALGFLAWADGVRMHQVERLTNQPDWSVDPLVPRAASPTGYEGGMRKLLVPGHDNYSYQWIAQTQQMFSEGQLRVRRVAYENAPIGREVLAPSPYRWWLGVVSLLDYAFSGRSIGLAVEHAALYADPAFHALLLLGTAAFVAIEFGVFPAVLVSVGIVFLFPFGGGFLPGEPDEHGLEQAFALWSVLPLIAGFRAAGTPAARRWFFLGGVAGGLGMWVSVINQLGILGGIALAALPAAFLLRRSGRLPWRAWAVGGAATVLAAYLIDYFPAHPGLGLEVVNPLLALGWLAAGELLHFAAAFIGRDAEAAGTGGARVGLGRIAIVVVAAAIVVALPLEIAHRPHRMIFQMDPSATRLTNLSGAGVVVRDFKSWIDRDGLSAPIRATCLPALILVPALALLFVRRTGGLRRAWLAIALGPSLVALVVACHQLHWWNMFDGTLLALAVGATAAVPGAAPSRIGRCAWAVLMAAVTAPGVMQLLPPFGAARDTLTELDAQGLIERDLAHWLAKQSTAKGTVVLAAPNLTTTLCYHGGLGGIGTLNWENFDGVKGAIRIAAATEPEEALALIQGRKVAYIVVPSWDMFLERYAAAGLGLSPDATKGLERSFVGGMLAQTQLPPWIQLVPYQLPTEALGADKWVMIFKVVPDQEPAVALSRTTEYFIEMNSVDRAAVLGQKLRRFPSSLAALTARAHVEYELRDDKAFEDVFRTMLFFLSRGEDRTLPWDRRVSLAVALAQGKRNDLAAKQLETCVEEVDEAGLRSLSTTSLFVFQKLTKAFGLEITDPRLHKLALDLLTPGLRSQI